MHTHTQLPVSEDKLGAVEWQWGMVEWQQNWRRAEEELEEVNRRSDGGGSLLPHWRCLFFPHSGNKNRLKLTVEPLTCLWPGERDRGRRAEGGTDGEGSGCEMGACCCFEVPPRIWRRPIKQDYKSGATFLLKLSIHNLIPHKLNKASFY